MRSTTWVALPYQSGAYSRYTTTPGTCFCRPAGVGLHPVVGAGFSPEDRVTRPGGQAGPLGQSQERGRYDALLDPDEHDDRQRDDGQGELGNVEAVYGTQLAEMEKPRGDENEHCPQSRLGQVFQ